LTTGISAQDLNLNTTSQEKLKKSASERKISFAINISTTYVPKLPSIESAYSVYTYDEYAVNPFDSITTITSVAEQLPPITSNFLYSVGLSIQYKLKNNLFLHFNPFYSIFKPKYPSWIFIDDQSNSGFRPQWDREIFSKFSNYIGLPVTLGLTLKDKLSVELGAQYLMSTVALPKTTLEYQFVDQGFLVSDSKKLNSFVPLSGLFAMNYKFTPNFTFNLKCNFGVAFFIPNRWPESISQNYYTAQNQLSYYYLFVVPKSKASVSNFSISTGLSFSF
jgi:hypothetical protein